MKMAFFPQLKLTQGKFAQKRETRDTQTWINENLNLMRSHARVKYDIIRILSSGSSYLIMRQSFSLLCKRKFSNASKKREYAN